MLGHDEGVMLSPWLIAKSGWNYLLGKGVAGRNLVIFPDDVFLISYPRSGNTWTRFLIANLIQHNEAVTFKNIERIIPDIYVSSHKQLMSLPRPRLIKTHEPFESRYKKTIYIVRDPRDVAVSLYHWLIKRAYLEEGYAVERFVERFIAAEFEGTAGSWGENVATWLGARGNDPNFLLLRYEDMIRQPQLELAKVAAFLSISATQEQLLRAVEMSSSERMRALEKSQSKEWATTRKTRQDRSFIRSAKAGGWKSELPESAVGLIEAAWWPIMQTLGYELATSPGPGPGRPIVTEEVWSSLTARVVKS